MLSVIVLICYTQQFECTKETQGGVVCLNETLITLPTHTHTHTRGKKKRRRSSDS